jgi:hypothetical protein
MKAKKYLDIRLPHLRIPLWWPNLPADWRTWLPSRGSVLFTLLVVGALLWAASAGALPLRAPAAAGTSTGTIAYQGRLADANGNPLTGTYNMIFRLYDAASGGTPLWTEQWTGSNGVRVSDGLFNVMLGSLTPVPQSVIAGHDSLFLGITVGTDDEMTPRVQLGSVPFAVQALTVPDASITGAKIATGGITTTHLLDGAVTQAKLGADVSLAANIGGEGGASYPSVYLAGWIAGGGTNLPNGTWVNTQFVTLPTKGVYLVISNFRIYGTNVPAFVSSRLRWTDSASRETEHRMIVERAQSLDFMNYGGSVSWVINVDQDGKTVYADYFRYGGTAANEYYWQSDGNGVPRLVAVRLY